MISPAYVIAVFLFILIHTDIKDDSLGMNSGTFIVGVTKIYIHNKPNQFNINNIAIWVLCSWLWSPEPVRPLLSLIPLSVYIFKC